MKTFSTIGIIVCFFLFSFSNAFGQSNSAKIKKNDLAKSELKGNVKMVTEFSVNKKDDKGQFIESEQTKTIMLFNDKGNITEESKYDSKGNIDSKRVYEYDANGNLIMHNFYIFNQKINGLKLFMKFGSKYDVFGNTIESGDYSTDGKNIYTLKGKSKTDDKGNIIESIGFSKRYSGADTDTTILFYKYDEKGNRIEETKINSKYPLRTYKYDDRGNRTESCNYNADGSISSKETSKYDENNNLVEYYSSFGSKYLYIYDSYGNCLEKNSYKADGSKDHAYSIKWVYEYDASGSWTKKTEFDRSTIPKILKKREIVYN